MLLFRSAESSRSSIAPVSCPLILKAPPLGRSSRPMMFISVDLPQPDGPTIDRRSPRFTSSRTPRRISLTTGPVT